MAPSTLGTFLRAFTFGHVRQLDRVLDVALARAWAAGAGPGDLPLVIDIDSFVGEVYGDQKQGAAYGRTHRLGYHPLVAVRSDTGEVIHIRNRKGSANTQRGSERFIDELLARVHRAGHTGLVVIRADSGFENHKQFKALDREGVEFSIGVKRTKTVRALIAPTATATLTAARKQPQPASQRPALGQKRSPQPSRPTRTVTHHQFSRQPRIRSANRWFQGKACILIASLCVTRLARSSRPDSSHPSRSLTLTIPCA